MIKLASALLAASLCIASLSGAAEAATRYRNSTNANAPGPQVHKPMAGMMMHRMHHRRMRHHMMMGHHKAM